MAFEEGWRQCGRILEVVNGRSVQEQTQSFYLGCTVDCNRHGGQTPPIYSNIDVAWDIVRKYFRSRRLVLKQIQIFQVIRSEIRIVLQTDRSQELT